MSIKKKIRKTCLLVLGHTPEPEQWDVWNQVMQLAEVFGERKLQEAFDEWADTRKGDQFKKGPLTEFLKVAPGLCTGIIQLKPKGDLFALLNDLAGVADNRVLFNREQQAAIGRLMADHSPADIKAAFQEFWGNISGDDFLVRQAAKTFTEAAEQLLFVRAKRVEDARKQAALIAACTFSEQEKARTEAEKAIRDAEELEALVEDTLPGENIA